MYRPRGFRSMLRPIIPGALPVFLLGAVAWAAALSGIRIEFLRVPLIVQLVLELGVLLLARKGLKLFWAARKSHLRLLDAQAQLVYAFTLQALVLLLPREGVPWLPDLS